MTTYKSQFMTEAVERGFLFQCTDTEALDAAMAQGPVTAYIGFDATADSLHVGSMVPIMLLHLLQRTGHKPIVLLGGGTTKIGDPSGKDESRQLLTDEIIQKNMDGIARIFARILKMGTGPTDAMVVNNDEWLRELKYIELLRDVGPHFSINRMVTMDSVKLRLEREQNLTFLEFNYMILQSYDFLELRRKYNCTLQLGGSDQWGNIVSGIDLVRRMDQQQVYGFTAPLITTASGAKMGKTAQGAVWLNEERLSPYDYWQFWRNTEDGDVGRFLRLFTTLPMDRIRELESFEGAQINEAKKVLADEATALVHGRDAVAAARQTAEKLFESHSQALDETTLPTIEIASHEFGDQGIPLADLFVRLDLASSKGDARRLIKGGGARLQDAPIEDELSTLRIQDFDGHTVLKLSAGKKRHGLVKLG